MSSPPINNSSSSLEQEEVLEGDEVEGIPPYVVKKRPQEPNKYIFPGCVQTKLDCYYGPNPTESKYTVRDLHVACVESSRHDHSFFYHSYLNTFRSEQREEHHRKSLRIALEAYTKQNNMKPTDLEFVEVKERNLIPDGGKGYLHFNFLAKGQDGKHTMFFAELHHNVIDEKDVYLCKPLGEDDFKPSKENDQAICKGCRYRARDLVHPSCGSFLAGHKYTLLPEDSDDEERDEEFLDIEDVLNF